MGKLPYLYTDSEETDTSSSLDNLKKKKRSSILKYTSGNVKKKKCKYHSKSEPDESDLRSRSRSSSSMVKNKLRGILKHTDKESSDEDDDICEPIRPYTRDRCLVGRVPRPAGSKPGRGGGVALIVRKNVPNTNLPSEHSSTSSTKKRRSSSKRLTKKRSY